MVETWTNIDGYNGEYEVSSLGRIKSYKRYPEGRILKCGSTPTGYRVVTLSKDNVLQYCSVHKLVALHFIPYPEVEKIYQVNHRDGNKENNDVSNLEWVTCSENHKHAFRTGLRNPCWGYRPKGELNNQSKLNEKQVRVIKWLRVINPKLSDLKVGKIFGMSEYTMFCIRHNKTWKHVKI